MTLDAAEVGQVIEIASRVAAESIRNLGRGTGGATLPVPVVRTATVGGKAVPGGEVSVRADGDLNAVPAINAAGVPVASGDRVLLSWLPPLGIYVTNLLGPGGLGILDKGEATTNQSGISAVTFITGLTVSFDAEPGREYEIIGEVEITQTVATDVWLVTLVRNGTTQVKRSTGSNHGTEANSAAIYYSSSYESGVTTFTLTLERAAGTGTLTAGSSAVNAAQLVVKDVGVPPFVVGP